MKEGVFYIPIENRINEAVRELQAFGVAAVPGEEYTLWAARIGGKGLVIVGADEIKGEAMTAKPGSRVDLTALSRRLVDAGFERKEFAERPGEFAVRGGILDVVFKNSAFRVVLFGEEVEEVREFSPYTQLSTGEVEGFIFILPSDRPLGGEVLEIPEDVNVRFNPPFGNFKRAAEYVRSMTNRGYRVYFAGNPIRLALFPGTPGRW